MAPKVICCQFHVFRYTQVIHYMFHVSCYFQKTFCYMFHVSCYQWYLSESILLYNPLAPVTCFLFPVLVIADRTKKSTDPGELKLKTPLLPVRTPTPTPEGIAVYSSKNTSIYVNCFMFLVSCFWISLGRALHVSCFVLPMVPFGKYPVVQPLGTCYMFPVSSFGESRQDKKKYRPRWAQTQDPSAPSQNSYPNTRGDCCLQQQKYKYLCKTLSLIHI